MFSNFLSFWCPLSTLCFVILKTFSSPNFPQFQKKKTDCSIYGILYARVCVQYCRYCSLLHLHLVGQKIWGQYWIGEKREKRAWRGWGGGRAFRFSPNSQIDFLFGPFFHAKIDIKEISALKMINCLEAKVNLYCKEGKFSKESRFYIIKLEIMC